MKNKILLIDDSVTIHRVIDLCVDKDNFDVFKVFSRDEAVIRLKSEKPDLVLLDNKLANIKASEMVADVREFCPDCWIILLVGAFDQFEDAQCAEAGADDYIYKPFDSDSLEEKIAFGLSAERAPAAEAPAAEDMQREEQDEVSAGEILIDESAEEPLTDTTESEGSEIREEEPEENVEARFEQDAPSEPEAAAEAPDDETAEISKESTPVFELETEEEELVLTVEETEAVISSDETSDDAEVIEGIEFEDEPREPEMTEEEVLAEDAAALLEELADDESDSAEEVKDVSAEDKQEELSEAEMLLEELADAPAEDETENVDELTEETASPFEGAEGEPEAVSKEELLNEIEESSGEMELPVEESIDDLLDTVKGESVSEELPEPAGIKAETVSDGTPEADMESLFAEEVSGGGPAVEEEVAEIETGEVSLPEEVSEEVDLELENMLKDLPTEPAVGKSIDEILAEESEEPKSVEEPISGVADSDDVSEPEGLPSAELPDLDDDEMERQISDLTSEPIDESMQEILSPVETAADPSEGDFDGSEAELMESESADETPQEEEDMEALFAQAAEEEALADAVMAEEAFEDKPAEQPSDNTAGEAYTDEVSVSEEVLPEERVSDDPFAGLEAFDEEGESEPAGEPADEEEDVSILIEDPEPEEGEDQFDELLDSINEENPVDAFASDEEIDEALEEAEECFDCSDDEIEEEREISESRVASEPDSVSVVSAVEEAVDDNLLRESVKSVLSDKITSILREELPGLLEKAIKEEIERLVKGGDK